MMADDPLTRRRSRTLAVYAVAVAVAVAASAVLGLGLARLPLRDVGALALVTAVALVAVVASAGRQRSLLVIGATAYVGGLHWVYVDWVVPEYASTGLINSGVAWPELVVVTMIALAPTAWLPIGLRRPSDLLLWPLYLFGYVPAAVIPIYILGPSLSTVLPLELTLAIALGVLGLMQRMPRVTSSWPGVGDRGFLRLLMTLGLGGIIYLLVVFAPTSLPDIAYVYDTRALFAATSRVSAGSGYVVTWLAYVIYPFLLTLGLSRRRPLLLSVGIGGQVLIYAVTGLKGVLFSILLLPILYAAIRYGRHSFGPLAIWSAVEVLVVTICATVVMGSILPLALFATRLIAIPGQLTAYYYDFFTSHTTYLLSHSFLRWVFEAPYDIEPAYLIGRVYLHHDIDANANIWADAMANFGLVGVIPVTIVFGAVLWILDSVASGKDLRVIGPVVGLAGIFLANGALFTQILTGGIAVIVVVAALMPRIRTQPATQAAPQGP